MLSLETLGPSVMLSFPINKEAAPSFPVSNHNVQVRFSLLEIILLEMLRIVVGSETSMQRFV